MYFYFIMVILALIAPTGCLSVRKFLAHRAGKPAPRLADMPLQVGISIAVSWIAYVLAVQVCYQAAMTYVLARDGGYRALPNFEQARELGRWHEWLPPSALMVQRNIRVY